MLVKLLGVIDIISGIILILGLTKLLPSPIIFIVSILLLSKTSLGMLQDIASWFDFLGGIILLMTIIIFVPWIVQIFVGILILQKGIFSFI